MTIVEYAIARRYRQLLEKQNPTLQELREFEILKRLVEAYKLAGK